MSHYPTLLEFVVSLNPCHVVSVPCHIRVVSYLSHVSAYTSKDSLFDIQLLPYYLTMIEPGKQ